MPGDTLYVNNKAQKKHGYDAIVVGSGISGGWAAKELCEKGLKVLLLERGREWKHPDYPTAGHAPWDFKYRLHLTENEKKEQFVQSRHWSYREDNKHFYIKDAENPYDETKRFDWIRGDIVGGRSLLWSRACYRWSDLDFEANRKDGIGVDWPIRYKDIAPWYDYVESFVGVSGHRDGIPHLPDGIFQPPFEMNMGEKLFKEKIEKVYPDRKVIIGRSANLTTPLKERGKCMARDLCHRGCPYGAYFSSNSATLPAALATGNLTILADSLVNKVLYDEHKKRAIGIEIIHTKTKAVTAYYSKLIFLNASTIATAFILLNSVSSRFPNGLGNGSDQAGRNLMDHHKGVIASATIPGLENWYYNGRRPTNIYIPRFKNLLQQDTDFIRGYHYGGNAYRARQETNNAIGTDLKDAVTEPGPWKMNLYAFGECLPYADNRVTLHTNKKDAWGRPLISIDCSFRENEQRMNREMAVVAGEMLEAAGFSNIVVENSLSFPGNANHEMGTARMGNDPKTAVLNAFNQMHEVPNVFITDGSCMTSGSCVNPSVTYMALTARACNYAVKEMKRLNL
jgi:choline dehydrogenase-like flavoprotein